jgi:hypothetical protein
MINKNILPIEDLNYDILPKHHKINTKLEKYFPPAMSIKFKIPINLKHQRTAREKYERLIDKTPVNPLPHTFEETGIRQLCTSEDIFRRSFDRTPDTPEMRYTSTNH